MPPASSASRTCHKPAVDASHQTTVPAGIFCRWSTSKQLRPQPSRRLRSQGKGSFPTTFIIHSPTLFPIRAIRDLQGNLPQNTLRGTSLCTSRNTQICYRLLNRPCRAFYGTFLIEPSGMLLRDLQGNLPQNALRGTFACTSRN
jgi:hypothetical protein